MASALREESRRLHVSTFQGAIDPASRLTSAKARGSNRFLKLRVDVSIVCYINSSSSTYVRSPGSIKESCSRMWCPRK